MIGPCYTDMRQGRRGFILPQTFLHGPENQVHDAVIRIINKKLRIIA
jgi:hypothetical protein